jgi:hypothetical protein
VKVFFKGHKHLHIYQPKGNKSRNFLKPIHHKVPQIIKRKQNHKETISHGSPCDSTINHKETISHGSPCDSTMNHKETISHGAHDFHISHCTMIKLWNPTIQLTPLNNYLSNYVITSSYRNTFGLCYRIIFTENSTSLL